MTDSKETFRRFGLNPPGESAAAKLPPVEPDPEEAARCFGYLRGVRDRAANLELQRAREGDSISFPYSWLGPTRFDPSRGVMLVFSAGDIYGVRIRGRNLNALQGGAVSLYDRGILRQRVTWVREAAKEAPPTGDVECIVERIEITRLLPEKVLEFLGVSG